jgi:hypothetical protein
VRVCNITWLGLWSVWACNAGAMIEPSDAGQHSVAHDAAVAKLPASGSSAAAASSGGSAPNAASGAGGHAGTPGPDAAALSDSGVDASEADSGSAEPTTCAGAFCEDFESGGLRTDVWTRKECSKGNSAAVQSARVAHGQYAAQFHAQGGTSVAMIFLENLPAALQKHYFGRLYYYATGFPTESGGHTAYVTSSNTLMGFPYSDHHLEVASYVGSSGPIWQMTYWTGDGPEYIGSGGKIPVSQWFCLEWEFNDEPDQIAVWVDGDGTTRGASFRDIHNNATGLLSKLTTLGVGFRTWHPMGAPDVDIFVDDIVLNDRRVGCLPQ